MEGYKKHYKHNSHSNQTKYSVNQLPGRVTWSSIQTTNLLTRFLVKPNVDLRHKNTNQKVIKKNWTILIMGNNLYFSTNLSCALEQSSVKGPFTDDCSSAREKWVENSKLFPIKKKIFDILSIMLFENKIYINQLPGRVTWSKIWTKYARTSCPEE